VGTLIEDSVGLAYPDPKQRVMVVSDASAVACAAVVLQVSDEEWNKPPEQRRGHVLSLFSHVFSERERRWTTTERELFPLHAVVTSKAGLFAIAGRFVTAYTDHLDLVHILEKPSMVQKTSSRPRVMRHRSELGVVNLKVVYMPGALNAVCDYLSRNGSTDVDTLVNAAYDSLARAADRGAAAIAVIAEHVDVARAVRGFLMEPDADAPKMPTEAEVAAASHRAHVVREARDSGFTELRNGAWIRPSDGGCFVPPSLRARVVLAAHAAGHRGREATRERMRPLTWLSVEDDLARALEACVPCAMAAPGSVRRALGEVGHAERVGLMLHADYMDVAMDDDGYGKLLVVVDDLSNYIWAFPCKTADAYTSVAGLRTILDMGVRPTMFVADQGSHFEGVLNAELERLGIARHRHVPYTPSANGTVERANRELLHGLRTALVLHTRPELGWRAALDRVVHDINTAARERLGGRSPHDILYGALAPEDAVAAEESAAREANVASLKAARRAAQHARSARGATPVAVKVGDLVLVSTVEGRPRNTPKLASRWQGPARVEQVLHPYLFAVRFVGSDKTEQVHARRLKPLPGTWDADDPLLVALADVTVRQRYVVEAITLFRVRGREIPRLLVRWKGYGAADDTWEPVTRLYEDVPSIVTEFLDRHRGADLRDAAFAERAWAAIDAAEGRRVKRELTAAQRRAVCVATMPTAVSYAARRAEVVATMPRVLPKQGSADANASPTGTASGTAVGSAAAADAGVPLDSTTGASGAERRSRRTAKPKVWADFVTG
jgi:hypothetical protein